MLVVLDGVIKSLPEAQRLVLTMRDVNGSTSEEVCNVLAISETNQRVLLHRARSKVRSILENHYSNSGRGAAQTQRRAAPGERDRDGSGIHLQATDGADNGLPGRAFTAN